MATPGEDVYATLLLNDLYLPGALVLAHSLRDAGTTKKLAVLVTTDGVSADAMVELQKLFDYIIPVERVANGTPANLSLMDRPDLHSTFTKINLWKQTQFRKIVYLDADTVALRAPDELFDLPQPFSAAPDIGWPDIFNSGVMALTPNMGDYYALLAMAQRGISFDGADQGLLNMHFKNSFNRLSFTYNVTPSAHYQYLPAYRHFQSSISIAHFIGQQKPWTQGREANKGSTPYDEMVGRWWAVYDRHYRESVRNVSAGAESLQRELTAPQSQEVPAVEPVVHTAVEPIVQYYTKGEFQPSVQKTSEGQGYEPERYHQPEGTEPTGTESETFHPAEEESHREIYRPAHVEGEQEAYDAVVVEDPKVEAEAEVEQKPQYNAWDASKAPPPSNSQPEAENFPATIYTMSSDPTPWKAPERFPDPPKDMYYEVPKTPTYQKPAPIFPWEKDARKPSRVFLEDAPFETGVPERSSISDSASTAPVEDDKPITVIPAAPAIRVSPADTWQTFTRGNAWDDIPEIERYIGNLQKNRKGNIQLLQGYGSELERPSLPVTPAPIRRPTFWGNERDDDGELPQAEGVPSQEDWDPAAQLEQLARRQSDVLASKLQLGKDGGHTREIPMRPLPYGSEGVTSPTYVAQASTNAPSAEESGSTPRTTIEEPSYKGPSAAWEKEESYPTQETPMPPSEEEKDVLET